MSTCSSLSQGSVHVTNQIQAGQPWLILDAMLLLVVFACHDTRCKAINGTAYAHFTQ